MINEHNLSAKNSWSSCGQLAEFCVVSSKSNLLKETTWKIVMWQWDVCHENMKLDSVDRLQYFTGIGITNHNL